METNSQKTSKREVWKEIVESMISPSLVKQRERERNYKAVYGDEEC